MKNNEECVSERPQTEFKGLVKGFRASSCRFYTGAAQNKSLSDRIIYQCFYYRIMKKQALKVAVMDMSSEEIYQECELVCI